jgi:hypothetical protein
MACQPTADLGVLVGSIVVGDHMDGLVGRHLTLDGIEKANEFLVPVALHAAPSAEVPPSKTLAGPSSSCFFQL